jgi:uncharacterized protein YndB with AHSA1/START domain
VWAKAKNMKEWLAPPGYAALTAEADFRVGGQYHLRMMEMQTGMPINVSGTYIEICPPEKVVYTWPLGMIVTVQFHSRGDSTEVVLQQESCPSEKSRDQHATGWNLCLDRLANDFPASSSSQL